MSISKGIGVLALVTILVGCEMGKVKGFNFDSGFVLEKNELVKKQTFIHSVSGESCQDHFIVKSRKPFYTMKIFDDGCDGKPESMHFKTLLNSLDCVYEVNECNFKNIRGESQDFEVPEGLEKLSSARLQRAKDELGYSTTIEY